MRVGIKEAARELGVRPETLRRWEAAGKIDPPERTPGGTRRYDLATLRRLAPHRAPSPRSTLAYARVSSPDQKEDLARQIALLESFCAANGWTFAIVQGVGSGLDYQKKGLRVLLNRLCSGEIERLVLTHKDRLLRFGSEPVFALCEYFGTDVLILNASEEVSFEDELVSDVREIITVFAAHIDGSHSHKNKQLLSALRNAAAEGRPS